MININVFDYSLPEELIAKIPAEPRDSSRLLVLENKTGVLHHHTFTNIIEYLKPDDLLVLNDSKVFPARLLGEKQTGGKVEILLNHQTSPNIWEAIGRNLKVGDFIKFPDSNLIVEIINKTGKVCRIKVNMDGPRITKELLRIGQTPLPPYIQKISNNKSQIPNLEEYHREHYQTVYAKDTGSVAAPTAGLHFTKELLEDIKEMGVEVETVTLHVGLGTFAPIEEEDITKHRIHKEYFSVEKSTLEKIVAAKKAGRRVIAVGTTTTRVLETVFGPVIARSGATKQSISNEDCHPKGDPLGRPFSDLAMTEKTISGWTQIYIYPGYQFKCIDGLITNFHLPKSSLLVLVSALAGRENIVNAYKEAIEQKYRFYSYGDAMLII